MIGRVRSERGSVLATTMILLSLMTMGGLATWAYVDGQTLESGRERVRETTFNVGEELLGSQVFFLSRDWPGRSDQAYPTCTSGNAKCPDGAALVSAFGGPDVAKGVAWQTRVLDNKLDDPRLATLPTDSTARCAAASRATPSYYDDAAMTAAPIVGWDQNGDCRMWVRAQAAIDGRRRTFIGLVRVDQMTEEFPRNAITAGNVSTGNRGRKKMIDTDGPDGQTTQPGPVAVRCQQGQSGCLNVSDGQIDPPVVEYSYTSQSALTPDALQRLRERAQSLGTYYSSYSGCDSRLAGPLVFIENASIECVGNLQINAPPALPGLLIVGRGAVKVGGTTGYWGLIHHANLENSSDLLVRTSGTASIRGAISVDGPGGVQINASGENLVYDPNVFPRVVSYGNAGIIQNTWREIVPAG